MKESIKTTVIVGDDAQDIEIEYDSDVISIIDSITGKELFSGDWLGNFRPLFERCLEIWPEPEEE